MNAYKFLTLIVVTLLVAILLGSALNSPAARVADNALAANAPISTPSSQAVQSNAPANPNQKWMPIIFLNAPNDLYWSIMGNGGTNPTTNFLGTTDNVSLTFRVSNTVALRIEPAIGPVSIFSPNIVGGVNNTVASGVAGAMIGGGYGNKVNDIFGTIGGGFYNTAGGSASTVSGGYSNFASGIESAVGGGQDNWAVALLSTIGGGRENTAYGEYSVISGGQFNRTSASYDTIAGGRNNYTRDGGDNFIGGGQGNVINSYSNNSVIGGGESNNTWNVHNVIGGGYQNNTSGNDATVSGGGLNNAAGDHTTIGGGGSNDAHQTYATVGGGHYNSARGYASTVPGGESNTAALSYTFAAGYRAKANHQGSFVWGDSTDANINSSGDNQFVVRANGGIAFVTSTVDFTPTLDVGVFITTSTGAYLSTSGVWTDVSNKNAKTNFETVNRQQILAQLMDVPITMWNYRADTATIRHIGPTAQDFYATFNVGNDNTHLAALDTNGVALASVQGLYEIVQAKDTKIAAQEKEIKKLTELVGTFDARLATIEQGTNASPSSNLLASLLNNNALTLLAALMIGLMIGRKR